MRLLVMILCSLGVISAVLGQTCWDSIPTATPDSRFRVTDEEVTDMVTGLIWQRCSLGQSEVDCSVGDRFGRPYLYSWQQALQAAEQISLDTGVSWRLPNIKELESIVEQKCFSPSINATIFPNTGAEEAYWSSTPQSSLQWVVRFKDGFSTYYSFLNNYVRLVRGE